MTITKTTKTGGKAKTQVARARPIKQIDPAKGIKNVQDLADHLHVAAQVELSTIPLYLYATYSIRTDGHSQWAAPLGVLRSLTGICIEEMLHLALVRNLMVAIGHGDEISFYDKEFIPTYPGLMMNRYNPDDKDGPEIILSLERLSRKLVSTFRRVEIPDEIDHAADTFAAHPQDIGQYTSLGAFYRSIEKAFCDLEGEIDWALDDARKQYKRGFWNEFGSGKPIRVYNLETALKALDIIIEQGEGTVTDHARLKIQPTGVDEYTHYEKFLRIEQGEEGIGAGNGGPGFKKSIDDPDVTWPIVSNPRVEYFKDQPAIHSLMTLFNAAYCYMLCLLDDLYQVSTDDVTSVRLPNADREESFSHRYGLERNGIALMQGILYPIARTLVSTPIPGGSYKGLHAAPPFEFYDFNKTRKRTKKQQLGDLFDSALQHFPVLGGPDGVQRQISLLTEVS